MYLKYGDYQHAANEVSLAIAKQTLFTEAGIARGVRERWTIQGRLQAADQEALSTAIDELMAAYQLQAQDVGLYFDDDQPTSHVIETAATNGGVRVIVPPSFPEGRGAEYSTFRSYTIVLEAEHLADDVAIIAWHESISFQGGGPQFAILEPLVGAPLKQLLKESTAYRARQSGEAIGLLAYPLVPDPIWPDAEHVDRREIRNELPKRAGPPGSGSYTQFRVQWSYEFEDPAPLVGTPTAWPL